MTWKVIAGDCIEGMRELADASVDAIVTDPPYGIGFLGHAWDQPGAYAATSARNTGKPSETAFGGEGHPAMEAGRYDRSSNANRTFQLWCEAWGREALRVLKPGGHAVVFGATRTFHRLTAGLEDAGFEIRDTLMWLFGQGFPKGVNVSKAIDRRLGAERPVIGSKLVNKAMQNRQYGAGIGSEHEPVDVTESATDEARQWEGWNTALKPAYEPIILARKPTVGTTTDSVLTHGTGALNIDGCRIAHAGPDGGWGAKQNREMGYAGGNDHEDFRTRKHESGRWPATVLCDEEAAAVIDEESGDRGGGWGTQGGNQGYNGGWKGTFLDVGYGDSGGPARFFYQPKTSTAERNAGMANGEPVPPHQHYGDLMHANGTSTKAATRPLLNAHPTVKPIDLMRWLCRLITPPGGTVLDPFLGSGSTGCAAVLEGFDFIGCEREAEYVDLASQRIDWWSKREGADTEAAVVAATKERAVADAGQLGLGL